MPSPADGLITTDLDVALDRLRHGGLVAIPTETVYGLAADAEQPDAVGRIFEVKGRPRDHPLIVHVAGLDAIDGWTSSVPEAARTLGRTCWPGPLTMLLPRGERATDAVTGGRPTVGLRAPAHPLTHELLERFGGGLAAPSANRFGKVSPTSAEHVLHDLAEFLVPGRDAILDGGPSLVGVESTIVDLTVEPPQVLRAGAIDADEIGRLLATAVAEATGPSRASGMLEAHYEPDCLVVLADSVEAAERRVDAARADGLAADLLDRTDDVVLAAQLLYADLRDADRRGLAELVVVLPPATGIGVAIRDRLTKAAAGGARRRPSRDG
ncbi:translation factor SUA5 [Ilumatobacter fluminis]|uniref:Threonylcarbamoyl-AMP synthase n=1 Tax=Ilumatobacter fluminis TaxID=467091 RepID=A0A4R7HZM0_9ACTN|nr:L-threonylcarbamoyladenylate synthase [Ilumatobacter fluminis]TDT16290.1 translation factor SUA5 [Ilumatobacter fluminis]